MYTLYVSNGYINGVSSYTTVPIGTTLNVSALPLPPGYQYDIPVWTGDTGFLGSIYSAYTTFTANTEGVYSVNAQLLPVPSPSPSITPSISVSPANTPTPTPTSSPSITPSHTPSATPTGTFNLTVTNGTANGVTTLTNIPVNTTVNLQANTPQSGSSFSQWVGSAAIYVTNSGNPTSTLKITQPGSYDLTATYATVTYNNYSVTMQGGTIQSSLAPANATSGTFPVNTEITISANAPATGKEFASWTVIASSTTENGPISITYTIGSTTASTTTFKGTSIGVATIVANYRDVATTFNLYVNNGSGSGMSLPVGVQVAIAANPAPSGQTFNNWSGNYCVGPNCSSAKIIDVGSASTGFIAYQSGDYTVYPQYIPIIDTNVFSLQVVNGTQSGTTVNNTNNVYHVGTIVNITANAPTNPGEVFDRWEISTTSGVTPSIADIYSSNTTFTSQAIGVFTITAKYKNPTQYFNLTVTNGTNLTDKTSPQGYQLGTAVSIKANDPAEGNQFAQWTTNSEDVTCIGDPGNPTTTFTGTVAKTYQVTATYATVTVNNYQISVVNGTVNNQPSITVAVGTSVNLAANQAAAGYRFTNWTLTRNGDSASPSGDTYAIGDSTNPVTTFSASLISTFIATANYEPIPSPTPTPTPSAPSQQIYTLSVLDGGSGSGDYTVNTPAFISAPDRSAEGYKFDRWSGDVNFLGKDLTNPVNVFTGTTPGAFYSVTPTYVFNNNITLTVTKGTPRGKNTYPAGTLITIRADTPGQDQDFAYWSGDTFYVSDPYSDITFFTAPPGTYSVNAVYSSTGFGDFFFIEAIDGIGGGTYALDQTATISFNKAAVVNGTFAYWAGDTSSIVSGSIFDQTISYRPGAAGNYSIYAVTTDIP